VSPKVFSKRTLKIRTYFSSLMLWH